MIDAQSLSGHRLHLRLMLVAFSVMLLPIAAECGPRVIEDVAKLTSPDPSYTFGGRVAIDGDSIIVTGSRIGFEPHSDGDPFAVGQAAFLFQRQDSGQWTFIRKLVEVTQHLSVRVWDMSVAMKGGIAVVAVGSVYVFERTSAGWGKQALSEVGSAGKDVAIDAGTILAGDGSCTWGAVVIQKDPAGVWRRSASLQGLPRKEGCDDEFDSGYLDISGTAMVVMNDEGAQIWEGPVGSSTRTLIPLPVPFVSPFQSAAAIENADALFGSGNTQGTFAFHRDGGSWSLQDTLRPADALMIGGTAGIELLEGLAPVGYPDDDHRGTDAGAVAVFERDTAGSYQYVAKLLASDASANLNLGRDVGISDRTIVASGKDAAYVFEIPPDLTQPTPIQDDFEDGNSATWNPLAGSSFSVENTGSTFVYRQSSLVGSATSVLGNTDWRDQSIQADVRATAFNGSDRWFGMVTRFTNADNYYYVTMRGSNSIQLRKIVNGTFQPLAAKPITVALNRNYRLRLESVGTWHRVYLDGKLLLQAQDSSHSHGQGGVITFKTSADYDNVVLTPDPQVTLYADEFESGALANWTPSGEGAWSVITDGTKVMAQASTTGGARSVSGVATGDQIVQVRAKARSFASGATDRWFGAMTRYTDDGNYYYVTLRSGNSISLRKLVNGSIVVLDTAPFTVRTGTWYTLRFEAVGELLRAYVNGRLVLEATDSTHPEGRYGPVMFRTSTVYDSFVALQP